MSSYYSLSAVLGENIAAGHSDPLATVNQWLCDAVSASTCASDVTTDGHRAMIMSSAYAGGVACRRGE